MCRRVPRGWGWSPNSLCFWCWSKAAVISCWKSLLHVVARQSRPLLALKKIIYKTQPPLRKLRVNHSGRVRTVALGSWGRADVGALVGRSVQGWRWSRGTPGADGLLPHLQPGPAPSTNAASDRRTGAGTWWRRPNVGHCSSAGSLSGTRPWG